jgi:hypothetical protein
MPCSVYYDSCIFPNAQNPTHREHEGCSSLTIPSRIAWEVWICPELIDAESTARELAHAFEVNCALEGKYVGHVEIDDGRSLAKKRREAKRQLRLLQLKDRDFLHLMCAVASGAEVLTSVDPDFWDATNKRTPNAKQWRSGTKRIIEKQFPVLVLLPSEVFAA